MADRQDDTVFLQELIRPGGALNSCFDSLAKAISTHDAILTVGDHDAVDGPVAWSSKTVASHLVVLWDLFELEKAARERGE